MYVPPTASVATSTPCVMINTISGPLGPFIMGCPTTCGPETHRGLPAPFESLTNNILGLVKKL